MYRECCGRAKNVISLSQNKWRRSSEELRRKLGEFAEEIVFLKEAAAAQEVYFALIEEELTDIDEDMILERCFEWFLFDYPLSNGQTILELFQEVCGHKIVPQESLLLKAWQEARCDFYEVNYVLPGKGASLRNLMHKDDMWVRETGIKEDIVPGSILYVRVLKVGEEKEFSTSAIGLPEVLKAELVNWLEKDYKNWQHNGGNPRVADWPDYLRTQAHRINSYVVSLGLGLTTTGLFLTEKAERSLIPALKNFFQGDLLKQICATPAGREYLEELTREVESAEEVRQIRKKLAVGPGQLLTANDSSNCNGNGLWQWSNKVYAEIAVQIETGLVRLGYEESAIKEEALQLWYNYCCQEQPVLRKPQAWIAAVIYSVLNKKTPRVLSQHYLARMYGVSPSSVSGNFKRLRTRVNSQLFERDRMDHTELIKIEPLIYKILQQLKY